MAKHLSLAAKKRENAGKGAARAARREGYVPAVIYGDNKEPVMISIQEKEIVKAWHSGIMFTQICDIDAEGEKHLALTRDIQAHPVTDRPIHVDFLRVTDKTRISVSVPVNFINEEDSPGLSRGGVLNIVRYEIEVFCQAKNIPEGLTVDLSGLELGENISFSKVQVPEGVTPTIEDRDFVIATVTAPSALRSKDDSEAEGAEEGAEGEEAEATEETSEE